MTRLLLSLGDKASATRVFFDVTRELSPVIIEAYREIRLVIFAEC